MLYRSSDNNFYVFGDKPVGDLFESQTIERQDKRCVRPADWDGIDDDAWEIEEYSYKVTNYISLLTPDEIINKFIELIKETAVIIKDSEFFLKYPIVTTGIAKVFLDNCVAHVEGEGFINVSNTQGGDGYKDSEEMNEFHKKLEYILSKSTTISNSTIFPMEYHKYGSQNREDFLKKQFPKMTEYHIKVNKADTVINTRTDKRGYPGSCGIENKNKDVVMIVRGNKEQETMTISELKQMIEDAEKKGIKKIEITKQILIDSNEKLRSKLEILSS